MSDKSKIEWTDATWNPLRGCTKVSPGCKFCYAEAFAKRFEGVAGHPYEQGFLLRLVPHKLFEPLAWTSPKTVFVNSMSDLFHPDVPTEYIVTVAQIMAKADWHVYQVLTKRSDRMRDLLKKELKFVSQMPHIWWGVSVEDRKYGVPRISDLQQAPVETRFLSAEPLLEDLGDLNLNGISWVIVGGESGRGAREIKENWVQSILETCSAQNVPFFFKQWGGVQKSRKGRELNNRTYDALPPIKRASMPERPRRIEILKEVEQLASHWITHKISL